MNLQAERKMTPRETRPARRARDRAILTVLPAIALGAWAGPASAQHEAHSAYAGGGSDEVQTLTPEEVASLRAAEGMGLARPAELNGYPGPRHVLDLGDSLGLTTAQRARVQAVFDTMEERARELGERIIEGEKALDAAFAAGADPGVLEERVGELARLQGALRWTHLRAHLETTEILSVHQRHEYDRLRGYGGPEH